MEFKQSRTYQNLMNSYKGEISGVVLYKELTKRAEEEGHEGTKKIFALLSRQEGTHGRLFNRFLKLVGSDGKLSDEEIENLKNMIKDVKSSLMMFAQGEKQAGEETYPMYSEIAKEEGYDDIANLYRKLAKVELSHSRRLMKELEKID